MWNRQPPTATPTPAPCLHLLRRMDRLPRWAAASLNTLYMIVVSLSLWIRLVSFFVLLPTPHPVYVCVCLSLLYCSVTRSRSSLSLVYVLLSFFLFLCMQAEWAGAGTSCLCGLQCSSESFCSATVLRLIFSRS